MIRFIRRHLDPATRLGEVLFGLIMALGITGAVRFGLADANNRELLIAVLGCNIAWGIVDGVMFAMLALFERGRRARIVNAVLNAETDQAALDLIHNEVGTRLEPLMTSDQRVQVYRWVLDQARKSEQETPQIQRVDILGGIAVGALMLLATLPAVMPFLLFLNPNTTVRISNAIILIMMFGIGWWWGQTVGTSPFYAGASVAGVGLVMVLITIALGG